MKVAVVHEAPIPTWSSRQLILAFEELGVEAIYLRASKIVAGIFNNKLEIMYSPSMNELTFNAIVLRNLGYITLLDQLLRRLDVFRQIESMGIPVINPADKMMLARDKYASLMLLKRAGMPVPETIVTEDIHVAMKVAEKWRDVVIKPIIGSMGLGSIRTSDPDVVYRIARTLLSLGQPLYIQKYVEKPNRDIRLFVVSNEVIAAAYRIQPTGYWKTNVAQGAKVKALKPDKELEELAIKSTEVLGLHYSGVDIAESNEGYIVLEVNASPNWKGLMKATGINPAKYIAKHIIELIRK